MRMLKDGETPTLEMIKDDLAQNPPGQDVMNIHIQFAYNAPSYIAYLLNRLERAERPLWHRALARISQIVRSIRLHELFHFHQKTLVGQ